jgi:uncharacterized sporulation protein YeaH/YhbH (DUF444 family)
MHAMGIEGRLPGARVYKNGVTRGTGPWAQMRAAVAERDAIIARLEADARARSATIEELRERIAELEDEARPFVALTAKLDALLARPAGVVFAPDHRRVADGGRTVKAQRKALRPTG